MQILPSMGAESAHMERSQKPTTTRITRWNSWIKRHRNSALDDGAFVMVRWMKPTTTPKAPLKPNAPSSNEPANKARSRAKRVQDRWRVRAPHLTWSKKCRRCHPPASRRSVAGHPAAFRLNPQSCCGQVPSLKKKEAFHRTSSSRAGEG